ncbi:MAG: ribonuclease III [Candidatus Eremiobacteraeota bacterium]|nr:ribonuclease III [Candidatus Eremiobacteraeota bacterium]
MSGEQHRRRLRALLRLAGVRAAGDLAAVERAFVHESYAKERGGDSNERMEFLGDSILGYVTAAWLYERYPEEPEGQLTVRKAAIVNDSRLAQTARQLGFSELVQLGAGMRSAGGADNTSILADAFEAFVAALYAAYGLERARRFVIAAHVERIDHDTIVRLDAKTRLQHFAQANLAATPTYRESSRGTPQQPAFTSRVSVKGKTLGTGSGSSKKAAQQAAAEAALNKLQAN